ncbi:type III-A CRISPR-associated protein Csm2 [Dissulfurispira thermophila]|uniref:CRISPR system Cms protein Csm2 n=1 Tax=Dissulfurispira thermophila TaxID=2715679 RepID=A0A7G1H3A9_9BACT|nr:type III-A CRISPR-associated protein Csm2 [Dissulfurispira thermophila]BCB96603.1 type III-A CRISPR-associated protein Csm2 [Dissulfurispira thermophila]
MPEYRQHHRHQQGQQQTQQSPVAEMKEKIKRYQQLKAMPAEEIVSIADRIGAHLKNIGLKTTQIRKFLDGIRKIDTQFNRGKSFNKDTVILLKPKLAYAAGRQERTVKPLMEVLDPAIDAAKDSYESFKKLLALIEGIVAYHKYYGGGD